MALDRLPTGRRNRAIDAVWRAMTMPLSSLVRSAGVTRGADVGLVEIVALEQERPAVVLGHGVGKAITEVELRGVAASFAIARKRRECRLCFLRGDRNELDSSHF